MFHVQLIESAATPDMVVYHGTVDETQLEPDFY